MEASVVFVWVVSAVVGLVIQYLVIRTAVMDAGRRLLDEQAVTVTRRVLRELEADARAAERAQQTQAEGRGRRRNIPWEK